MSIILQAPPKFLGQAGPQTDADWVSLQRWFTNIYNFLTGTQTMNLAFSTNLPYDDTGTPDTRPGTWGNAGYRDVPWVFLNVPAGQVVQIMRVYGTHQGWAQNTDGTPVALPPGSNAGILFGLLVEGSGESPYVTPGLGSSGCPLYIQNQVGPDGATIFFDLDLSTNGQGILGTDNTLTLRLALFLNNTGLSIHQEFSGIIEFQYVSA